MVRQPYSVAVLSTGGRLHPSFLRREGLVRMWSSLWLKGDGGIRNDDFFNGKEGRDDFRKYFFKALSYFEGYIHAKVTEHLLQGKEQRLNESGKI